MNRNLDADVVELIYNWQYVRTGKDYDGENDSEILAPNGKIPEHFSMPPKGKIHKGFLAPTYSSDLRTAIDLAKKVKLPIYLYDVPDDAEKLTRMCLDHFKAGLEKNKRKS